MQNAFNALLNLNGIDGVLLNGTIIRFVIAHDTRAKIIAVNTIFS